MEIYGKSDFNIKKEFLESLSNSICDVLNIERGYCWVLVHNISEKNYWIPHWNKNTDSSPIIKIRCKESYGREKENILLELVSSMFCKYLGLKKSNLFILLDTTQPGRLYIRNDIWKV